MLGQAGRGQCVVTLQIGPDTCLQQNLRRIGMPVPGGIMQRSIAVERTLHIRDPAEIRMGAKMAKNITMAHIGRLVRGMGAHEIADQRHIRARIQKIGDNIGQPVTRGDQQRRMPRAIDVRSIRDLVQVCPFTQQGANTIRLAGQR